MDRFTCPSCGARYLIIPEGEEKMKRGILSRLFGRGKGEFEASRPWQTSVAQPIAPQAVGRPPTQHDPVMTRHVRLPLAQANIFGFYTAWIPTVIAVIVLAWTKAKGWWWAAVPITFIISALASSGIFWAVLLLVDRITLLLNEVERFIGVDLNRDGVIGKPTVRVERIDREKRSIRNDDLPVDMETLREMAHAILQLRCNFSKRGLAKHTSLSAEKAAELLAEMRGMGFARFNTVGKPESGTALTKDGLDLLEEVL